MTPRVPRARERIETPCINVCVLDGATGLCTGCFRTAQEIGAWATMTPDARRAVMDALPERARSIGATRA